MDKYVIIDIETTGHAPKKGDRIIEIGLVVIQNHQITKQYSRLVNPEQRIPEFISQLTSIQNKDVENEPTLKELTNEFLPILQDAVIVAHNITFDLNFLNEELERIGKDKINPPVIDTVELARIFFPKAPSYKLSDIADYLMLSHEDPHRAIADALVTADLFLLILKKWQSLSKEVIETLMPLSEHLKSDFSQLIPLLKIKEKRNDLQYHRGIMIKKLDETEKHFHSSMLHMPFQDYIEQFYQSNGYLSQMFRTYERRKAQQAISEKIYDHFRLHKHAMIEAETGIGKTIAYLIPVIYEVIGSQRPIVISTASTNLQEQLLFNDIKKLNRFFSKPITATIVKGKNHYLSLAKFEQYLKDETQSGYHHTLLKAMILVWLTETNTGDLDEIQLPLKDQQMMQQLVVDQEYTAPTWVEYCFYQRMKKKASQSQIIVTNHALLCMDMINENKVLPSYSKLIIDEAHHLESVATNFLGRSISYFQCTAFLQRLEKLFLFLQSEKELDEPMLENGHKKLADMKFELDQMFRQLFHYVRRDSVQNRSLNDIGRLQKVWDSQQNDAQIITIKDMTRRVILILDQLILSISKVLEINKNKFLQNQLEGVYVEIRQLSLDLRSLLLQSDPQAITWLEIDQYGAENAVYLYHEPFSVNEQLKKYLFDTKESVILMSATLTMNNSFQYIIKQLGIETDEIECYKMDNHFPYEQNVKLMIPNDLPKISYPNNDWFIYAICESILSLAFQLKGKILVLFTSYEMLRNCYYILKEQEELSEYLVIGQGVTSGSRNRLIKHFQSFEKSILLGTNAYWEGIDIPGEDLSCLVIVKLPFQSPNNPLFQKKSDFLKAKGRNPFMELSLPKAVLQFKQGFGRLIRKQSDRGVVFVFDDRLMTKKYGDYFLQSIPSIPIQYAPMQELLKEVEDWL
ncbi:ATP-dependent DNA helicase DinG [Gracilibacillus sp. YIM 98692]|uniref:ATP-dependent DNA helicase DinG n=1 Tax=Gracilibacillus sp. YIM 98692 TaxID=2663532 RepID=UPI0013D5AB6F|nr:ATP-dependent DNA helicase DinG [Gracilibacillus sp. YIM 98692]